MLSIRYILLSFFRLEKCLEFSFTMLAQSGQHFNGTSLRHWPVLLFSRGAFQINVKVDLRIFRFGFHRWRLIVSPVSDLMYLFIYLLFKLCQSLKTWVSK